MTIELGFPTEVFCCVRTLRDEKGDWEWGMDYVTRLEDYLLLLFSCCKRALLLLILQRWRLPLIDMHVNKDEMILK